MSSTLHFLLAILIFQFHFAFPAPNPNPNGLSLRAVLDDSPQSPFYNIENLTIAERIDIFLKVTNARISYLQNSVLQRDENLVPEDIHIPILRDDLYYTVAFTIGSNRYPVKLLLDTGGGLVWTQCQPCKNCFPQRVPIYDPRVSTTYATLPCSHPLCHGDHRIYNCINGVCVYSVEYAGGASTNGVASFESVQFFVSNVSMRSFNNVIFGCSNDSRNIFFQNREISGIFGLNASPDSMSSQFLPLIHSRFSYCLVPFRDAMPRAIVLRFGEDIPQPPQIRATPLLFVPEHPSIYFLELLDVSVANHRLGFPPDTFETKPDGTGGFFIDSGILVTNIDSNTIGVNAYEAIMRVFEAYYGSQGLQRVEGPRGLELCYKTPPNYHDFAAITFHFENVDYTVPGEYGHIIQQNDFCVAILRSIIGRSALGAFHQQNKRIIYDRGMGELQFADEQCVNDVL